MKRRKTNLGTFEDVPGYNVTMKNFPMGHGEKSLVLLLCSGLELTDAEMLAIRWHMGPWGSKHELFRGTAKLRCCPHALSAGNDCTHGRLSRRQHHGNHARGFGKAVISNASKAK